MKKTRIISWQHYLVLGVILILSFLSRFYRLGQLPQAFFTDEMALGYNGWSLLTTGKDEWGETLPLVMRSFDDYKPAIYAYLTVPGIAVLGLSQLTARLPAAVFGSLLPLFVYLLIRQMTKNKWLGLLTAAVVLLSPWHVEISRTAIEAGVALSLAVLALYLSRRQSVWSTIVTFVLGFLIMFTYHTARLIFPILLITYLLLQTVNWKNIFKTKLKRWLTVKIGLAFVLAVIGIGLSFVSSQHRFAQISIFNDANLELVRAESIREDGGPITVPLIITRLFHNKLWSYLYGFADSYLTNTSPHYLFLGGAQPPRVMIPQTGQFLLIFLPFLLIGLIISLNRRRDYDWWLLFWALLAPVPASLTLAEIPHSYRTLFLLVPLSFYIAQGLVSVYNWVGQLCRQVRRKSGLMLGQILYVAGMVVAVAYFAARSWHQYRVHQQLHQPWHRQYGYQQLVSALNKLPADSQIYITTRENEPYIALLFYNQIHPKYFQQLDQKRLSHQKIEQGADRWMMPWESKQYIFVETDCPHQPQDLNPNHYYVGVGNCQLPSGYERLETIKFMDGVPEFQLDHPQPIDLL